MLFAIDGRQEFSIGASVEGLADIMIEHGVWQGMSLDGGGSTSLLAGSEITTRAVGWGVDDNERRIANALLVIQKPVKAGSSPKNLPENGTSH